MRPKRRRRYKGYYRNARINKRYFKKYEKLYKRALYEIMQEKEYPLEVSRVVCAMTYKSIIDTIETANMLVENPNIMKCR